MAFLNVAEKVIQPALHGATMAVMLQLVQHMGVVLETDEQKATACSWSVPANTSACA